MTIRFLATGTLASEYVGHLLEVARAVSSRRLWGHLELSQSSALKDRLMAALNPNLDRRLPRSSATNGGRCRFGRSPFPDRHLPALVGQSEPHGTKEAPLFRLAWLLWTGRLLATRSYPNAPPS